MKCGNQPIAPPAVYINLFHVYIWLSFNIEIIIWNKELKINKNLNLRNKEFEINYGSGDL